MNTQNDDWKGEHLIRAPKVEITEVREAQPVRSNVRGPKSSRRREEYEACAKAGLTQQETARRLRVKISTVKWMAKTHGIDFRRAVVKE